jgi:hypothetical protein
VAPNPLEEKRSRIDGYLTRDAVVYYLLVLPAFALSIAFSLAIATAGLVTSAAGPGGLLTTLGDALPFVVFVGGAFSIFSFRPSLLVVALVGTFFIGVSVSNGIQLLGISLNLPDTVVAVLAATFLALAGFNYSRGLELLAGRRPYVVSTGPPVYNLLGVALESAVPLGAALGLVLVVGAVVGAFGAQAADLPQPLSSLAQIYLQTRIGLVFTTLFVAGAAIWILRQFVEPVILHFTLTRSDARKELLAEIEPTLKSVRKVSRYRPTRGIPWAVLTIAYSGAIAFAMVAFSPGGQIARDLVSALTLKPPSPTPTETLLQSAFQNGIVKADILFAQSQDYVRQLIKLLWG